LHGPLRRIYAQICWLREKIRHACFSAQNNFLLLRFTWRKLEYRKTFSTQIFRCKSINKKAIYEPAKFCIKKLRLTSFKLHSSISIYYYVIPFHFPTERQKKIAYNGHLTKWIPADEKLFFKMGWFFKNGFRLWGNICTELKFWVYYFQI